MARTRFFGAAFVLAAAAMAGPALAAGETTYEENCASCHQPTGRGLPPMFPALAGSAKATAADPGAAIAIVLNGRGTMPPFKDQFDDRTIAGVLTFVRSAWGNAAAAVQPAEVTAARGGAQ